MNISCIPERWPSLGTIRYENVSASYSSIQDSVLREVSFTVDHLERVGVVGRTGAGKSSLALTLLRGLEIESGRILLDGLDTKSISLQTLRRRLAFIPRDPTLFAGTLRFNLDPLNEHSDEEVMDALWKVGLLDPADGSGPVQPQHIPVQESLRSQEDLEGSSTYRNKFTNLSFPLTELGSNISQG